MKPIAIALLIIAMHLGVAWMAASRHLMLAPSSFALLSSDPLP